MGDAEIVATVHLDEMVDPNFVAVASIEKRYLPARKPPTDGE
ncbi:MAG TPA: hypothetical protein VGH61_12935 [Steroidobacteraceae bacterium]